MSRPRIVHVYKDVYPPVDGGIERAIYHMARLTRNAYEPLVITASSSGKGRRRSILDDVEVIEVPSLGRAMSTPIAPGFIKTDMTAQVAEAALDKVIPMIPLKRMGEASDIANMVTYLASEEANYITGQVFTVDGGMAM